MTTEPFVSVPLEGPQDDSGSRSPARPGLTMRQGVAGGFFTPALMPEHHHDHRHSHEHHDGYPSLPQDSDNSAHYIPISQIDNNKTAIDLLLGDKPPAKKAKHKPPKFFLFRYIYYAALFISMLGRYVVTLWRSKDTRPTLLFIFLVLSFIVVQFYYAAETESLTLTANACRFLLEAASLSVGLVNLVVTKHHPANKSYSYGLERFELVYAFSLGVFLIFLCLFIGFDALERVLEPSHLHLSGQESYAVGAASLVLNLISFLFFRHLKHVRTEARGPTARGGDTAGTAAADAAIHDDELGSFLLDAAASMAVIVSSWMAATWHALDALCGVAIAAVIFRGALPLCTHTGRVLLQTTPRTLREQLSKCIHEVELVEGVLECSNEHFWTFAPGVFVGSLHVRVRSEANEQVVRQKLRGLFAHLPLASFTVQIEKDTDPWPFTPTGGLSTMPAATQPSMLGAQPPIGGNAVTMATALPNGVVGSTTSFMDAGAVYSYTMPSHT